MGPRLVGRGKTAVQFTIMTAEACFNGAASCGTRKVRAAMTVAAISRLLQWGRVLWDAERSLHPEKGPKDE